MEFNTNGDGYADVAEGHDNSGAAAVLPGSPYDPIQIWHEAQGRIDANALRKQATELAIKQKQQAAQGKDLEMPNTKGAFDIDIQNQITPAVHKYLQHYGEMQSKNMHPEDPNSPAYIQAHQEKNAIEQMVQQSIQHNSEYQKNLAELGGANADKYDQEASADALAKWRALPVEKRAVTPAPTPIQSYDLQKGISETLKSLPKQQDAYAYKNPNDGSVSTGTTTYHTEDQHNQAADNLINQPQIKKQVLKMLANEPHEGIYQFLPDAYNNYKNSADYKPAIVPQNDNTTPQQSSTFAPNNNFTPTISPGEKTDPLFSLLPQAYNGQQQPTTPISGNSLAEKWDNMSMADKGAYGLSYPKFQKAMTDQQVKQQDEADKVAWAGMPLDQQKKYINARDYLKDKIVKSDAVEKTKGLSGGPSYSEIQGEKDAQSKAEYDLDLGAKVLTGHPKITSIKDGGSIDIDRGGQPVHYEPTEADFAGYMNRPIGNFSYQVPGNPPDKSSGKGGEPDKTETQPNLIKGIKKIDGTFYIQTSESEMFPKKYPNGVPIKDFVADVMRPVIINQPNGEKIWEKTVEIAAKKGLDLKAGSLDTKSANDYLGKKKIGLKSNTTKKEVGALD